MGSFFSKMFSSDSDDGYSPNDDGYIKDENKFGRYSAGRRKRQTRRRRGVAKTKRRS